MVLSDRAGEATSALSRSHAGTTFVTGVAVAHCLRGGGWHPTFCLGSWRCLLPEEEGADFFVDT